MTVANAKQTTNPQSYIGSRRPVWDGIRYVPQPPLTLKDVLPPRK